MAQRAFPNPYADFNKSLAEGYFDSAGRLTPEFSQRLNNKIRELLQQMERGLKSADPRDSTVYTGWAGIALLYLHLYDVFGDPAYLQMAHGYVKQSLNSLTKRSITFLCGDAGPLAVGAVVYHKMNNEKQAEDCITRLIHLNKIDLRAPNEMLYGRMGYIYALLFVNKNFGVEKIAQSHIQQICETVLTSGETLARKRNFTAKTPLMYEWYQEYYVGAAHGLAGIYYHLMQVRDEDGGTEKRACSLPGPGQEDRGSPSGFSFCQPTASLSLPFPGLDKQGQCLPECILQCINIKGAVPWDAV
ncbi:glutathione S-transferase LANCL1 [Leptonychotes weddellii]|uniref:Glutathione S-transferase LANCL1 n=1 Tax=Leptonychotes weddellii TaxID=9713 RepID=A0A7F8QPG8_LEPWE|nr:glutathione S-transferase LANCL1 [Leptonychotes weddellii]XP_030883097.1 glutathione S-transferase LANCL1 [Leptonychotes weddellii]XP_030883098.1 glutathione S-transferase LANCL1 [Leptonychotes weddellii]